MRVFVACSLELSQALMQRLAPCSSTLYIGDSEHDIRCHNIDGLAGRIAWRIAGPGLCLHAAAAECTAVEQQAQTSMRRV